MSVTAWMVGRVGDGTRTHSIVGGEWRYSAKNRSECGRTLTAVEYLQSGTETEVTCLTCQRMAEGSEAVDSSTTEFRVWNENGDLLGEYSTASDANECQRRERESCRRNGCHTNGKERNPGKGDYRCGVMHPHGIHIQIIENGQDVTASNYGQFGVDA